MRPLVPGITGDVATALTRAPQRSSRPGAPHPPIVAWLRAAAAGDAPPS